MVDLNFKNILNELKDINKLMPDIRFGSVLQNAIDHKKRNFNWNLNDISSKEILASLVEYKDLELTKRKRGR